MLPAERAKFFEIIEAALAAYIKFPNEKELEAWWNECKGLTLEGLHVAIKAHKADPDRGERAPRPADITRRLKTGAREGHQCASQDSTGRCEYPAIFSEGTMGDGPWHCPWHRLDRSGPEASRWIEISRNVPYTEALARRQQRMLAEAQRAPAVFSTAHAIALRHGNRPWQTEPFKVQLEREPGADEAVA